jgi:hypothetical protein
VTPAKTLDELERNVDALEHLREMQERVSASRRLLLKLPAPRDTCPGCFSAIYDGARAQGWCCDCWPIRASYERHP